MKPFPEAVQKAFPLSHMQLEERPWWSRYRMGTLERVDGVYASIDDIERVDAENPVSHPGYRVGQIWCNDRGDCQMITHSDAGNADRLTSFGYVYLVADVACPRRAPWSPTEAAMACGNVDRGQMAKLDGSL